MISSTYWPDSCTPLKTAFELVQAVRNLYTQKEEEGPIIVIDRSVGDLLGQMLTCISCTMDSCG